MNLTKEEFSEELKNNTAIYNSDVRNDIIELMVTCNVEFKEVPQRPRTGDYDLNDEFEMMKYVSELTDYTNYLETKI